MGDDAVNNQNSLAVVTAAVLAFAAWELTDHLLLTNMPDFAHSALSFSIESLLAIGAIYWLSRTMERGRVERARADRLAAAIAVALASDESEISPVTGVLKAIQDIKVQTAHMPQTQDTVARAEHNAQRIRTVSRHLDRLYAPRLHGQRQ